LYISLSCLLLVYKRHRYIFTTRHYQPQQYDIHLIAIAWVHQVINLGGSSRSSTTRRTLCTVKSPSRDFVWRVDLEDSAHSLNDKDSFSQSRNLAISAKCRTASGKVSLVNSQEKINLKLCHAYRGLTLHVKSLMSEC